MVFLAGQEHLTGCLAHVEVASILFSCSKSQNLPYGGDIAASDSEALLTTLITPPCFVFSCRELFDRA